MDDKKIDRSDLFAKYDNRRDSNCCFSVSRKTHFECKQVEVISLKVDQNANQLHERRHRLMNEIKNEWQWVSCVFK